MEGRIGLSKATDGSVARSTKLRGLGNPPLFAKCDRLLKLFGVEGELVMPSCQEKFLSISIVARTVNRHRWVR